MGGLVSCGCRLCGNAFVNCMVESLGEREE